MWSMICADSQPTRRQRLATARKLLADRLTSRGLALSVGALAALLAGMWDYAGGSIKLIGEVKIAITAK